MSADADSTATERPAVDDDRADIFLCYRREDTPYARLIWMALEKHFGSERIFWDREGIEWGADYIERIEEALTSSAAVVAIIGRNWLQVDDQGNGGIHDPADPLRFEIATALKAKLPIFPALVASAEMPGRKQLPEDIVRFGQINANRLSDDHWDIDIASLVKRLEPVILPNQTAASRASIANPEPLQTTPTTQPAFQPTVAAPTVGRLGQLSGASPFGPYNQWLSSPAAEELRARSEAERVAREAAQESEPRYYRRIDWWAIAIATVVACVVAALAADQVALWVAGLANVTGGSSSGRPELAAVLGIAWGAVFVATGTAAYQHDPRRGPSVFVTRGILGGWSLLGEGEFSAGLLGAFPLTIFVGWGIARIAGDALYSTPVGLLPAFLVLVLYTAFAIRRYWGEASFSWL